MSKLPPLPESMRAEAVSAATSAADMKRRIRAAYDERYGAAAIHTPASVIVRPEFAPPPQTETAIAQQRNAMAFADGRYPVGMSDCFVVGISGGCGLDCPVFLAGRCESHDEMVSGESIADQIGWASR